MATPALISESGAWKDLKEHVKEIDKTHLRDLMNDVHRCKAMMVEFDRMTLDHSRRRARQDTMNKLFKLVEKGPSLLRLISLLFGFLSSSVAATTRLLFLLVVVVNAAIFLDLPFASSQQFLGVNYGQVADNLPSPEATASLLKSTIISKVRLYVADPSVLHALAGTNISVVIGVANGEIPSLAIDPSVASHWVAANVLPFVPATTISVVAVGNEVLSSGDVALTSELLPAMQNMYSALAATPSTAGIKVSSVHIMSVLAQSYPPSSGAFHGDILPALQGILGFLQKTGSPFMINPYPYFAYRGDPRPETLAFCLFQPNAGLFDPGSKLTYTNMFDAQVDAVKSAVTAVGFPDVEIVVAETGWPYRGDPGETGATVENAKLFNGNLVSHLKSMVGTPLMPGRSVDTYIFALYDEDLKPGPTSERSFGLFRPDLTPNYDIGITKSNAPQGNSSATPTTGWLVTSAEATDEELQTNLAYACRQLEVDCGAIREGGARYLPTTVRSHVASDNPSYVTCVHPESSEEGTLIVRNKERAVVEVGDIVSS